MIGGGTNERTLAKAFAGRRVLVTGHTGFKGGWISLWLRRLGAEVVGIALPQPEPCLFAATNLERLIDSRYGDIRFAESFNEALAGEDFDLVIHMAAQALVRASYAEPVDTYMTNVVGTAVVLDAARRMPSLKGAIVVTSDKCYDNRQWVWGYRESDPMGGKDPYSSSKGCTELVAAAYDASFFSEPGGPRIARARAGNVFGGGDWGADRLIPDLMRAVESGVPTRIRNPRHIRPWQHVLEPVRGYLMLAAALMENGDRYAGGWNFGPDIEASVNVGTIADMVVDAWRGKSPGYEVDAGAANLPEAPVLRLDATKARVELGWSPIMRLDDAITETVDWYRTFLRAPGEILALTERQIADYAAAWNDASQDALPARERHAGETKCV